MKRILYLLVLFSTYTFGQKVGSDGRYVATGANAVIYSNEAKGTPKHVQTITDRNNIPSYLRDTGMLCYVITIDSLYQLKGGISNSNWMVFSSTVDTNSVDGRYGRLAFPNTWLQQNQFVQPILTDTIYAGKGGGNNPSNTVFSRGGMLANTTGDQLAAFGISTLGSNTQGKDNSGFGAFSLIRNTTGNRNSSFGSFSSDTLSEGDGNTTIGTYAGRGIFRGYNNTILGASLFNNFLPTNLTNNIILQTGQGIIRQRFDSLSWRFYTGITASKEAFVISTDTTKANNILYTEKLVLPTTGVNKTAGTDTLVNGTIAINTAAVNANSKVIISRKSALGSTALGQLVYTVTSGIITVESLNPNTPALLVTNDNSSFDWVIIN